MKRLNTYLTVRVSADRAKEFRAKAEKFGGAAFVVRELVDAFLDDRLVIHPDPRKESLYVNRANDQ